MTNIAKFQVNSNNGYTRLLISKLLWSEKEVRYFTNTVKYYRTIFVFIPCHQRIEGEKNHQI